MLKSWLSEETKTVLQIQLLLLKLQLLLLKLQLPKICQELLLKTLQEKVQDKAE